jgi:hypothetical protein
MGASPLLRRSTSDAASEVLRRDSHETTEGLLPYRRQWAGRVAAGEGPEAGLLGEPTWAGAISRDSGSRQRSKAEAQSDFGPVPVVSPGRCLTIWLSNTTLFLSEAIILRLVESYE